MVASFVAPLNFFYEPLALFGVQFALCQACLGRFAPLHLLSQEHLLLGGEQRDAPHLSQIHPDGVIARYAGKFALLFLDCLGRQFSTRDIFFRLYIVDDFYALVEKIIEDVVQKRHIMLCFGGRFDDIACCQETLFFSFFDKRCQKLWIPSTEFEIRCRFGGCFKSR